MERERRVRSFPLLRRCRAVQCHTVGGRSRTIRAIDQLRNELIILKSAIKMPPPQEMGADGMAEISCVKCGRTREIEVDRNVIGISRDDPRDIIRAVLICRHCDGRTVFELTGNVVTLFPGANPYGELANTVPENVVDVFSEAELCYYGMANRAAVSMSRACVEQALSNVGITNGNLEQRIDEAKEKGVLGDQERMLAHGSRLAGNNALHEAPSINPGEVPPVLAAAVNIVNHISAHR